MPTVAEIQMSNRIIQNFLDQLPSWKGSSGIISELSLPISARPVLLQCLHALNRSGVVSKSGSGKKLYWKLDSELRDKPTEEWWNKANPFSPLNGANMGMNTSGRATAVRGEEWKAEWWYVTGNTISHRIQLREMGCKYWGKDGGAPENAWYVPPTNIHNVRAFVDRSNDLHMNQPRGFVPQSTTPEKKSNFFDDEKTTAAPAEEPVNEEFNDIDPHKECKIETARLKEEVRKFNDMLEETEDKLEEIKKENEQLKKQLENNDRKNVNLRVLKYSGEKKQIKNVTLPKTFQQVRELAEMRRNILLVGPAGCGKTHLAKLISDSLMMPRFGAVNCTAGMPESHLLGRSVPNLSKGSDNYISSLFVECYEKGGLFVLDEMDASDPNTLLALNSGIDNGYLNVPARHAKPIAEKHPDFVLIATANTFGRGASREYAGRNQLDGATRERFRLGTVECDYDDSVEETVCPDKELRDLLQGIRRSVKTAMIQQIVSTRFMRDAYLMKSQKAWDHNKILTALTAGWTTDEINRGGAKITANTDWSSVS